MRSRRNRFRFRKIPHITKKKTKASKKSITIMVLAVFLLLFCLIHIAMRPVIQTISADQARILGTALINNAVLEQLAALEVDYKNLISFTYDSAGNIAAIETNAMEMNKLKATLTESVNQSLATLPDQAVKIPLGTLTGIELMSGRGPDITLKMLPSSYVESKLVNNFDAAGINQTRHQILIEFTVTISAILVPYTTTVNVKSTVVVAETIIVGHVPDMFANVDALS